MLPQEAIKIVEKNFPFEQYIMPERGAYTNIAETVLRYMQPGQKILDFGSGPCDKSALLHILGFTMAACDDLQDHWHTLDNNQNKIIAFAKKFEIDFTILSPGDPLPFEKHSFDLLMMNDILEHLHNSPRDLLNNLLETVKPQGLFLVTVPNLVNIRKRLAVIMGKTNLPRFENYYWNPGLWRGHIREYTKGDLIKLAEYLELDIIELRGCHHMLIQLNRLPWPIRMMYLGLTDIFRGWRDSWLLLARKKVDWTPKTNVFLAD